MYNSAVSVLLYKRRCESCTCCVAAGGSAQPGGEALRGQYLWADAHAGADASGDAEAAVRGAADASF